MPPFPPHSQVFMDHPTSPETSYVKINRLVASGAATSQDGGRPLGGRGRGSDGWSGWAGGSLVLLDAHGLLGLLLEARLRWMGW